ncbi:MAG: PAS domain S-box protein [Methylovulum sp.]|nr:PAS domain S-box protein [Methylovulum sp.]MCF7997539.1 PAS domain S-box protein [Methylovulum sp.]
MPNQTIALTAHLSPRTHFKSWIVHCLVLALAYFMGGKLGDLLCFYPDYATSIWPPSGIALAAILLYGSGVWPGVLLGAFMANFDNVLINGSQNELITSGSIALVQGLGATLQAITGSVLLKRFAGFPNRLSTEKEVFSFFLFGGVLSSLVNSSIGIAVLVVTGRIPVDAFFSNWVTWWLGDTFGIMLFTPLLLAWFQPHASIWQARVRALTWAVLSLFILSASLIYFESERHRAQLQQAINQQALELQNALDKGLVTQLNFLDVMAQLLAISKPIEEADFSYFGSHLLTQLSDIQTIAWHPAIADSDKANFEKSSQLRHGDPLKITERNEANQIIPATQRAVYFPTLFIEPLQGNEASLGMDLLATPLNRRVSEQALSSHQLSLSPPITLGENAGQSLGVRVIVPVYRIGVSVSSLLQRQQATEGFLTATLQAAHLIQTLLSPINSENLAYRVIDKDSQNGDSVITDNWQTNPPASNVHHGWLHTTLNLTQTSDLSFGGRTWQLQVSPTNDYFQRHKNSKMWLNLLGLMLINCLVAFFMVSISRRDILGQLVAHQRSLFDYHDKDKLSEAQPIGIAHVSVEGDFLLVNNAFCDLVGYGQSELLTMNEDAITQPSFQDATRTLLKRAMAGQIVGFKMEKQYIRKDGCLLWVSLVWDLVRDEQTESPYFALLVENIDAEKQILNTLSKLSRTIEQSPNAVLITDLDGNIEYVNEAFVQTTGYTREETLGENPRFLQSGKTPRAVHLEMWLTLRQKQVWRGEVINRCKNGELIVNLTTISPVMRPDGTVTHYTSISENINRRKQIETMLLESEQRFRTMADTAPVLIWLMDVNKERIWFNQMWLDFTGRTLEQELLNGWLEGVHPDDQILRAAVYDSHIENHQTFEVIYRLKHKDGSYHWLNDHGVPRYAPNGEFVGYIGSCSDITEMQETRIQLQCSYDLLNNLSRQVPGMLFQFKLTPEGHVSLPYCSAGISDIYDLQPEDVCDNAQPLFDRLHPDDYERVKNSIDRSAHYLEPWYLEYRAILPSRGMRWLSGMANPELQPDGNVLWHGFVSDITSQIFAKLQANHTKEALESVLSSATEFSIIATDTNGLITIFNRGAELMLGYTEDEMVGKQTPLIFHLDEEVNIHAERLTLELGYQLSGFNVLTEKALNKGRDTGEWTYVCKDGRYLDVSLVVTTMTNSKGQISGFLGIAEDITETKQANEERNRLLKIIEDAPDFIAMVGIDGNFLFINKAGLQMVGLSLNTNISELSLNDVHSELAHSLIIDHCIPSVFEKGFWQGENVLLHHDGHEIPVSQLVLMHADANGNPLVLSTIMRDISVTKQAEQALLKAKAAAENLAQSKSDFLAKMSHEIRTPMNAIIGLSQLALNKPLPLDIKDYLDKIYASSTDLLGILNDILDFSKLDAKRFAIDHALFDLDSLIYHLNTLFFEQSIEKKLNFVLDISGDVPRGLVGDKLRLQQVLVNLLGNAIKFTEHGEVTFAIRLLALEHSQVRLSFSVKDSGIGMSSDDMSKLFQPFSQVDDSDSRRFGGTGLGLAISQNLVHLMGSEISVESELGQGSTFSFTLILGVASLDDSVSDTSRQPVYSPQFLEDTRVLVVEDNRINQQVVKEFLELSKIHVEVAENGKVALERLQQAEYDAVLMDMHMPVMDGVKATQLIRQQEQFRHLPVIALTAGVTKEERDKCLAAGMNDLVPKPINPDKLLSTLARWLNANNVESSSAPVAIELDDAVSTDVPANDFDLRHLLAMLGNDQAFAAQLLLSFIDDFTSLPSEIDAAISAEQWGLARELVHKIKGAAGNVGAMGLYQGAVALEDRLKTGAAFIEELQQFHHAFEQAKIKILAMQPEKQIHTVASTVDLEALTEDLIKLETLLKGNDFISDILLSGIRPNLNLEQQRVFEKLCKATSHFKYNEALSYLNELNNL